MTSRHREMSDQDDLIADLLGQGWAHRRVADSVGVSHKTVQRRMSDPAFSSVVSERRRDRFGQLSGQLLTAGEGAMDVLTGALQSEDPKVKDTNNPIGPLNWRFSADSDIIRCALLAPLPRSMPHLRPRCVAPTDRVGEERRDHGAPTRGPYSRKAVARTSSLSASRSSDPRCTQPVAPPNPVAILPGHP
jgi:hypothetical protein